MRRTGTVILSILLAAVLGACSAASGGNQGSAAAKQEAAATVAQTTLAQSTAAETAKAETTAAETAKAPAESTSAGSAAEGLPAYSYPDGDPILSAVCDYMISGPGSHYDKADLSIPCINLVAVDEQDPDDVRVYADFWILNFDLDGTVLQTKSGGSFPGCMHLARKDGAYEVKDFEITTDGAGFDESAKKIFGDRYEAFGKVHSDGDAREELIRQTLADYVSANKLDITAYKDYGWDPVELFD